MPAAAAAAGAAAAAPQPGRRRPASFRIHVSREMPGMAGGLQLHGQRPREPGAGRRSGKPLAGRRDRLRVAVYADFWPVAYVGRGGELRGLDVDIVRGFCRAAGLEPQFVRTRDFWDTWDAPGAWRRRIDLAIGGIGRTTMRESETVEWSVPYLHVQRTVVYNLADPIRRFPQDATGRIVGTAGSTGGMDASAALRRAGKGALLEFRDGDEERDLRDLLAGRVQGLMRGSFVGSALVRRYPRRLGMVEPWEMSPRLAGPGGENFAFPCRRGSGLAAALTAHLLRLSATGGLAALVRKHKMAP